METSNTEVLQSHRRSIAWRPLITLRIVATLTVAGAAFATADAGVAQATPRFTSSCPNGYIQDAWWGFDPYQHEDLAVTPTECGRSFAQNHPEDAFNEVVNRAGVINRGSLYNQFDCHAIAAPAKNFWDLEPWRPEEGFLGTLWAKCNPDPVDPVYGVGIGKGVSTKAGAAIQHALAAGGNPPGLGQPINQVHGWGPGCIQDFDGGSRGRSAIMSPGCSGAAYWVGDYFWAYYENNFHSSASSIVGYPDNNSHRWGAGWIQDYAGGQLGVNTLMRGDGRGDVHDVNGAIRSKYIELGGAPGALGFPTSDAYAWNGNRRQDFLGGSIVWNSTNGARLLAAGNPTPPAPFYVHHVVGTCAEGRCGLAERAGPGYTSYAQVESVYDGQEIDIVCQASGEPVTGKHATSAIWDKLTNGSYVTDYYTDTPRVGAFSPPVPHC